MLARASLFISIETVKVWAEEFAPEVAEAPAVQRHQFWFGWNDVAAACSSALETEFARMQKAIEAGTPATFRAGDVKRKTLANLLDDSWWRATGQGEYGVKRGA